MNGRTNKARAAKEDKGNRTEEFTEDDDEIKAALDKPQTKKKETSASLPIPKPEQSKKESVDLQVLANVIHQHKRKDRVEEIASPESRIKLLKCTQEVTRELLGGTILDIKEPLATNQTVRLGMLRDIVCGPMESTKLTVEADSETNINK
jgi:hypothetical protein